MMILILYAIILVSVQAFCPGCPKGLIKSYLLMQDDTNSHQLSAKVNTASNPTSNAGEGLMKSIIELSNNTPGYTTALPISTTDRSQKDLIKLVLGITITLISTEAKLKQLYAATKNTFEDKSSTIIDNANVEDVEDVR